MGKGLIIKPGARSEMAFLSKKQGSGVDLRGKKYQFDDREEIKLISEKG